MPSPTERSFASGALLRIVAAWSSFGLVDLLVAGARCGVALAIEPSPEGQGSALARLAIRAVSLHESGANWLDAFAVITLVGLLARAALLAWAIRNRSRPLAHPWLVFALGVLGLFGVFGAYGLSAMSVTWMHPAERAAGYSIAVTLSGAISSLLTLVGALALLVFLTIDTTRQESSGSG